MCGIKVLDQTALPEPCWLVAHVTRSSIVENAIRQSVHPGRMRTFELVPSLVIKSVGIFRLESFCRVVVQVIDYHPLWEAKLSWQN